MAMADVVGSMGLTLFCNRCVETFFQFQKENGYVQELDSTCDMALDAFNSFYLPASQSIHLNDKTGLFNTNEAVFSFSRIAESKRGGADSLIKTLLNDLAIVRDSHQNMANRKKSAKHLQDFFDILGDYSFGTTRDCLRKGTMAEML